MFTIIYHFTWATYFTERLLISRRVVLFFHAVSTLFMQCPVFSRSRIYVYDNLPFYLSYLFHGEATYFTQSSFIFKRSVYFFHAVSTFFTQSHLCSHKSIIFTRSTYFTASLLISRIKVYFFPAVSTFFTLSVLCLRKSIILRELFISRRGYLFHAD